MGRYAYAALAAAAEEQTTPDEWPDGWSFPGPPWPPGFEDDEDDEGISYFEVVSPEDDDVEIADDPTLEWTFSLDGVEADDFQVFLNDVRIGETSEASYDLSDLDDETEYTWRIVARVGAKWFVGPVWTFNTKLAKPLNLVATAASSTQIDLTWSDSSAVEDSQIIERSLNGSTGWTQIASVDAEVESYSDTGLDAETQYFYRVRAYSTTLGNSDSSDVANATTPSAIPVAPSLFTCVWGAPVGGSRYLEFTWQDNSDNETLFKVTTDMSGNGINWTLDVKPAPGYTMTYAENATSGHTAVNPSYYFRCKIRAYNAAGYSEYSNEVTVSPYS